MDIDRDDYLALPDDERPHLYPDRAPSNATYTGSKNVPGCRCVRCKSAHAAAIKNRRRVIRVEPESVTDEPIPDPAESVPSGPDSASETSPGDSGPSVHPRPVYSAPDGTLTVDEVEVRLAKHARRVAELDGAIPRREDWIIAADLVASQYNVRQQVAQSAIRQLMRNTVGIIGGKLRLRNSGPAEGPPSWSIGFTDGSFRVVRS